MKNQQGAALVVVLSMLTMSLMLGLSSMQSSLIDERLAGNYKAAAEAQMAAEVAGAKGWGKLEVSSPYFMDFYSGGSKSNFLKTYGKDDTSLSRFSGDFCELPIFNEMDNHYSSEHSKACFAFLRLSGNDYIAAKGAVVSGGGEVSVSHILLLSLSGAGDLGNIINTVFECDPSDEECNDVNYAGSSNEAAETIRREKVSMNPDIFDDANQFISFLAELKALSEKADRDEMDRLVYYFDSFGGNKRLSDYSGNIVVVDGDFTWGGRDNFEGLLIVTGDILRYSGAGEPTDIKGTVILAPTAGCGGETETNCEFVAPTIRIDGGIGNLEYDPLVVNNLLQALDVNLDINPIQSWDGEYRIVGWK
ncbi:pilus assembly PilX family protein [Halomonas alkalisoli]|uniref:pilus assembly PilX family protein n=1 Tax=Halomonas alkalisoli TaxID=2907158 RepID=UPI001F2B5CC2|nr:pilus assembly PilX N-terminal domain-containing protein [Halomonas alkalisoli]MCE9683043.1 pilus assembly PilX N-terminal domain-containing protein [Halomonas alkalisoli]